MTAVHEVRRIAANEKRSVAHEMKLTIAGLTMKPAGDRVAGMIAVKHPAVESVQLYKVLLWIPYIGRKRVIEIHGRIRNDLYREILWLRCSELTERERDLVSENLRVELGVRRV